MKKAVSYKKQFKEGKFGFGWQLKGAVIMVRNTGKWQLEAACYVVSIPGGKGMMNVPAQLLFSFL